MKFISALALSVLLALSAAAYEPTNQFKPPEATKLMFYCQANEDGNFREDLVLYCMGFIEAVAVMAARDGTLCMAKEIRASDRLKVVAKDFQLFMFRDALTVAVNALRRRWPCTEGK